ncbi:MAG: hypothetical protein ACFB00_13645, partial [Parvularculaceae bacterium]
RGAAARAAGERAGAAAARAAMAGVSVAIMAACVGVAAAIVAIMGGEARGAQAWALAASAALVFAAPGFFGAVFTAASFALAVEGAGTPAVATRTAALRRLWGPVRRRLPQATAAAGVAIVAIAGVVVAVDRPTLAGAIIAGASASGVAAGLGFGSARVAGATIGLVAGPAGAIVGFAPAGSAAGVVGQWSAAGLVLAAALAAPLAAAWRRALERFRNPTPAIEEVVAAETGPAALAAIVAAAALISGLSIWPQAGVATLAFAALFCASAAFAPFWLTTIFARR